MTQRSAEELEFEWDEGKASDNVEKHGVTFDLAVEIFCDPDIHRKKDRREDYGEERWQATGVTRDGCLLLTVVYTHRASCKTGRFCNLPEA